MCQIDLIDAQWINISGIVLNIVGVSIVAFEWRTSMYDGLDRAEFDQGLLAMANGFEPKAEITVGPMAQRLIAAADLEFVCADDGRFAAFTSNVAVLDGLDRLNRRRTIFTVGFAGILLGAGLQLFAAWPC